jgi:hypothetical protein
MASFAMSLFGPINASSIFSIFLTSIMFSKGFHQCKTDICMRLQIDILLILTIIVNFMIDFIDRLLTSFPFPNIGIVANSSA